LLPYHKTYNHVVYTKLMATTLDTNGNQVVNGYSTNMTPDQYAKSSAIPVTSITSPSPTPVIPPVAPTVDPSTYTTPVTTTAQYVSDAVQQQADYEAKLASANNQVTDYSNLINQLGGKGADTATAYETGGVNKSAAQLNSLNAQMVGLNNEAQAIPIQIQQNATGQGVTDRGVAPIQAARLRENALKALSLGQQAAVAKADYDTAKSLADQQVALKYAPIEAAIAAKKAQLDYLGTLVLTPAQEKAKAAKELAVKAQERDLADKKAEEKAINDLMINAAQVAPKNVLAQAQAIKDKGGTSTQVAMALGEYGKDYLANQKLKLDLQKTRLDIQKTQGELSTQQTPEVTAWVSNIQNGKAKLSDVPKNLKSAVSIGLSTATSNGMADNAKIQGLKETADNIQSLVDSKGLSLAVGTAPLGRTDVLSGFRSDRQDFVAGVEQLLAGKTLDALIALKAQGGTLGALSEQEGQMMRSAASKIGAWRKVDSKTGNIYFDTSEASFKKELGTLKRLTDKAVQNAGGSAIVSTGNPTADSYFLKSSQSLQSSQAVTPSIQGGYVDNQK
jgi:hypothetical protein